MEKFRPFLRRNHCLMMICEAPLRLDPNKTEEDKYMKLGGENMQMGLQNSQNQDHYGGSHPNTL